MVIGLAAAASNASSLNACASASGVGAAKDIPAARNAWSPVAASASHAAATTPLRARRRVAARRLDDRPERPPLLAAGEVQPGEARQADRRPRCTLKRPTEHVWTVEPASHPSKSRAPEGSAHCSNCTLFLAI
jgi:hypothetical protein